MTIKNFRSIVNETIEFKNFNCFVGKNDSGKSNVLKALNLFFNGMTDFNTKFDFQSDYSKFAKRGAKQAKEIVITIEVEIPTTYKESGTKAWKKVWRSDSSGSNPRFDGFKTLFKPNSKGFTLLERMTYQYIPATKSNEYFKDLLSDVYASMTESANSALKDLNDEYSVRLRSLTGDLSKQIRNVLGITSNLQMPSDLTSLFRDLTFSTSDDYVKGVDLNHRGDGIKARHIPLILRYMQQNTEKGRPKNSVNGSYIWGFEEPENGLEYSSCYEMAKEFYSYISDCQIFITTHSPAFYTQSQGSESKCFFVEKNQEGVSKYLIQNTMSINQKMGLMQLVAPIISNVQREFFQTRGNLSRRYIKCLRQAGNIMTQAGSQLNAEQVLNVVQEFTTALTMLDDYDHHRIQRPNGNNSKAYHLTYDECVQFISSMDFAQKSDLFGLEKDGSFKSCIASTYQSFGGQDCYPSIEEKAANLLYLIIKDHPFADGNKRIAVSIFLHFLKKNNMLFYNGEKVLVDHTLVALTIMIAESKPEEKDTMINIVMNFLNHSEDVVS